MLNVNINDADFGGKDELLYDISRYGSRGVLIDEKGNVAMMLMEANGRYKLPGGGIELGENEKDAFVREIGEEVGCTCEIIEFLGSIVEHKLRTNFCHYSYVFLAKKTGECSTTNMTDAEKALHMGVTWLPLTDAISVMQNSIKMDNNSYGMNFMLLRDKTILEYVQNNCLDKIKALQNT